MPRLKPSSLQEQRRVAWSSGAMTVDRLSVLNPGVRTRERASLQRVAKDPAYPVGVGRDCEVRRMW